MQCPRCLLRTTRALGSARSAVHARTGVPGRGEPVGEGRSSAGPAEPRSAHARAPAPGREDPRYEAHAGGGETGSHPSERKLVTVLFADLKGSMELLADRDPEEVRKLLRSRPRAHDGGGPPLRGHGEPGDGRRHHGATRRAARPEDHAVRASYAAVRMQAVVKQYAEEVRRRDCCSCTRVGHDGSGERRHHDRVLEDSRSDTSEGRDTSSSPQFSAMPRSPRVIIPSKQWP